MVTATTKKKPTGKTATTVEPLIRRGRGRSWTAGVLLVIATLLLPTAVLGNWASVQVSNTNAFVDSLAPLAKNPAVQNVITDAISTQISKAINVDKLTAELADGLGDALNFPPGLQKILIDLSGPMAVGVDALIRDTVNKVVTSDAFSAAFDKSLRFTHEQLVALLTNDSKSMLELASDGTLSLPLGPLVSDVKKQLVDQKVPFAKLIPDLDASVTIAKVPDLVVARIVYQIGVGIGFWLPWMVFVLMLVSVAAARKHWRQVFVAGLVTFIAASIIAVGLSFGRIILVSSLSPSLATASSAVYDSILAYVADATGGLIVASVLAMFVGVLFGFATTARLRAWFGQGFSTARSGLESLGVSTGAFGRWLGEHRVAVRTGIVVVLFVLALVIGPLNPVVVASLSLLAAGLLVSNEILARSK